MKEAKYCIQCEDEISGKTGSFAFIEWRKAISPVFDSLADLFRWADEQEIKLTFWTPSIWTE